MKNYEVQILIVDDREDNLLVLEGILEDLPCKIIRASSGNEALGLMLEHEFALVLLDVQMPEMDGFEVAELMRSSEKTRRVPIVFITAIYKEQNYLFKGYEIGGIDYLFKPIEPVILRSKVNIFIELYQQKLLLLQQNEILKQKLEEVYSLQEINKTLHSLSNLDGLTGIPNRRSFDEYLKVQWADSIRNGRNLSLIMLDIDYFKLYNDRYGHLQGDDCLIKVAKQLVSSIKRPKDFAARYGGEEFVVILPETDLKGVTYIAETIRTNIEELNIEHEGSEIGDYVTISLGVHTLIPTTTHSIEQYIENTDKALYLAKSKGRNQVNIFIATEGEMETETSIS